MRDDFVRDTKTGSVFYQADACSECYMPRIIMYPGDGDKPEILEHCACRMLVADDE